jgi:peptide/nickel transport system substrate-binding protein
MRELLLDGNGTNMQYGPPADSPYYHEEFTNAYLDYDPDKANELLDNLGYTDRDSEGYRTYKDGSGDRITMTCLGAGNEPSSAILMLMDYFRDIGLEINYRGLDRSLRIEMHQSNQVEMTAGEADRNLIPLADPKIWIYGARNARHWAGAWGLWWLDPSDPNAQEPPADHWIWEIWKAYEELEQTVDDAGQKALFRQILDVWMREMPSPGLYGDIPCLVPVKNGFKGIHAGYGWDCCTTSYEHIIDNSTWYWDEPEKHS